MRKNDLHLLFTFLLSIVIITSFSQTNCLKAHYSLDGNATDISGNNYNGVMQGTTPTTDRFGNPNSALLFNGASDYIDLPSDFDYSARTLSLWVKPSNYSANANFVFISDHANMLHGTTGIIIKQVSGTNQIYYVAGSNVNSGTYTGALTNTWYHVAIVATANYVKYFINGVVLDSLPFTQGSSTSGHATALIGTSRILDRYFSGAIDDVRIYDCALSDLSIYQLHTTDIKDIISENYLNIYPIPVKEYLNVLLPNEKYMDYTVSIKNIQGQLIFNEKIKYTNKYSLNVNGLSNGLYILNIQNEKENYTGKFIVKK